MFSGGGKKFEQTLFSIQNAVPPQAVTRVKKLPHPYPLCSKYAQIRGFKIGRLRFYSGSGFGVTNHPI